MKKKKRLLFWVRFVGLLASLTPISIIIGMNLSTYIAKSSGGIWTLSLGGILAVGLVVIAQLGKLKLPNRIWFFAILLGLATFLEPMLIDLKVLCFACLVGELLYSLIFTPIINRLKRKIDMEEQANETNEKVKETIREVLREDRHGTL